MMQQLIIFILLEEASTHGYIYQPVSMQDLTYRLRAEDDWQQGMPESRRWEPGNARLAPGQSPLQPGDSCGIGYAGEAADPLYAEGLLTWQKWYEAGGFAVPRIVPGSELEVRTNLNADHGGQAWFEIACSDRIAEDVPWILLDRAVSDRGHHYMPSSPKVYAWAFGDVSTDGERGAVLMARWLVPESFSCPAGRAVGRWVWKVANTCVDADNLGISTERFSMDEYRALVNDFKQGQNVQGKCSSSPEQFMSCFVFSVASSSASITTLLVSTTTTQVIASTEAAGPSTTTAPVITSSEAAAVPTTTTTSILVTTTAAPRCEPIGDCSSLPFCDQQAFTQWCAKQELPCSGDFCRPAQTSPSVCSNVADSQCGGLGFSGESCCPNGHYCKKINDYWSQCYSCQYFPDAACNSLLHVTARRHIAADLD